MPVKRLGWRKYARRYVTDPKKIERGEKLTKQWEQEQEQGWKNPTRYARIIWKSKKRTIPAEIKIKLSGIYTNAQADIATWEKIEQNTGPLPRELTGETSPGLYIESINKNPSKAKIKYHYPLDEPTTSKYFLGSSLETRGTTLTQAEWTKR
jgi:hypothetical protein